MVEGPLLIVPHLGHTHHGTDMTCPFQGWKHTIYREREREREREGERERERVREEGRERKREK